MDRRPSIEDPRRVSAPFGTNFLVERVFFSPTQFVQSGSKVESAKKRRRRGPGGTNEEVSKRVSCTY